jgi:hypothetical protein
MHCIFGKVINGSGDSVDCPKCNGEGCDNHAQTSGDRMIFGKNKKSATMAADFLKGKKIPR